MILLYGTIFTQQSILFALHNMDLCIGHPYSKVRLQDILNLKLSPHTITVGFNGNVTLDDSGQVRRGQERSGETSYMTRVYREDV